ncbi:glycosyltransferase family 4 protein [Vagococcus lutrae]|uniref:glycosyltransferase family 4 protein n=1 Tax=Vagococcus lutrae TaxID=81947 RepID=UPI0023A9CDA1|nr:glycosyltransferase [Vagococcus lutrae]WEB81866.1 glycosyltransferase [Vagococcus lutrae]
MLRVTMFSQADSVKGQGVGSAYLELIALLRKYEKESQIELRINEFKKTDISHYHTINLSYYLSTFFPKIVGRRIGYVHFVPETLEDSLEMPRLFKYIFYRYVIAFYKRMDHLVVVNPSFIPVLEKYGISKEKVTYIPNFVSSERFYPLPNSVRKAERAQRGWDDRLVVLGAGQIQMRKGVDDFIRLAEENPSIQFIWAGGFSFGKLSNGYEQLKEKVEHPPDNLLFTGIVSREGLHLYYNLADIFLLPSHSELFPMCILEAFNCGTPVMLRDLPLYQAIIEDDYIAAKDKEEMSRLLVKYQTSPKELKHYQLRSKDAAAYYSEQNILKKWRAFYHEQNKMSE